MLQKALLNELQLVKFTSIRIAKGCGGAVYHHGEN